MDLIALLKIIKGLCEVVGLLIIGQLIVAAFNPGAREQNPIYVFLRFLTSPVMRLVRWVTPAKIIDKHLPLVTLLLMLLLWFSCVVGLVYFTRVLPALGN